MQKAKLWTAFQ